MPCTPSRTAVQSAAEYGAGSPREACITLMQGECVRLSHRPVAPAPGTGRRSRGRRSSRETDAAPPGRNPGSNGSGCRPGEVLHGTVPPGRTDVTATGGTGDSATAVTVARPHLSRSPPNTLPSWRGAPIPEPVSPASGRGAGMPGLRVGDALEARRPLPAGRHQIVAGTGA